jgi:hypothetical protein
MSIGSNSPSQPKTGFQCLHYAQSEIFTTAGMEFGNRISNFVRTKMTSSQQTAQGAIADLKQKACDLRTNFAVAKQTASERLKSVKAQMPVYAQTTKEALVDIKQKACDLGTNAKEKLPFYQEKVQKHALQFWDKLSPSQQRYAKLVFSRDAGQVAGIEYKPNLLEEGGNCILYPYDLLKKLPTFQDHPIMVGLVTTKVAMFALKLLAYPKKTFLNMMGNIRYLPRLTYLFGQLSIIGLGCRTMGRMTNPDLMEAFNAQELKQEQKAAKPVKAQSKVDYLNFANKNKCNITPPEEPRYRRLQ